jgi:predicted nucleic acid-binding Zn ribbon protein
MPMSTPELSTGGVHTPTVVPSCPMCGVPLTGKQTVCSGRCRVARSRQKYEAARRERDAKVRLLLTEALGVLEPHYQPAAN